MAKKTVMIVDDEPDINKVVVDILGPKGYKVVTAVSGKEALSKLKRTKPDLILIDFLMPTMSGIELCRAIRADSKLANAKVAFLTALTLSSKGMKELNSLDVMDFIKKPFDYDVLIRRVKKLIG